MGTNTKSTDSKFRVAAWAWRIFSGLILLISISAIPERIKEWGNHFKWLRENMTEADIRWILVLIGLAVIILTMIPWRRWIPQPAVGDTPVLPEAPHSGDDESPVECDENELLKLCKKELADCSSDFVLVTEMDDGQRKALLRGIDRANGSILSIAGQYQANEFHRRYRKFGSIDNEDAVKLPKLKECATECASFLIDLSKWLQKGRLDERVKQRCQETGLNALFPLSDSGVPKRPDGPMVKILDEVEFDPKNNYHRIRVENTSAQTAVLCASVVEIDQKLTSPAQPPLFLQATNQPGQESMSVPSGEAYPFDLFNFHAGMIHVVSVSSGNSVPAFIKSCELRGTVIASAESGQSHKMKFHVIPHENGSGIDVTLSEIPK